MVGRTGGMWRIGRPGLVGIALLVAGGAVAQVQISPSPQSGAQSGEEATQQPANPFLGSNPPSVQSQGGKSYYEQKQANPASPVRCDAFNRIGQGFDECRSRQLNQAWQQQQQRQAGNPPANPRLQPVDPLAKTRPYR